MPKPRLTQKEVLKALRQRVYVVDLTTGEVTRRRSNRVVTPYVKKGGRKLIRLYVGGKVKAIHLSRLVWMAGANRLIPKRFEVHHFDEENDNDGFGNLICLHALDHRKMHASRYAAEAEKVPF